MKNATTNKERVGESLAIATILNPLKDFSERKAGSYRKSFRPKYARFKLKFYKKDGETEIRYSYDFYAQYEAGVKKNVIDESEGLGKLLRLIDKRQYKYFTAVIFCKTSQNMSTDVSDYNYPLYVFVNNQLTKYEPNIHFTPDGKLDVSRLPKEPTIAMNKEKENLEIGKTYRDYHSKAIRSNENFLK